MMFIRLGKLVQLSWRKLLVAIALTPLMGFSLGSCLAHADTREPEAAAAAAQAGAEERTALARGLDLRGTRDAAASACSLTEPCVSSA